jgi:tRNA nucleotidyltransferase/poly(A) polymerase
MGEITKEIDLALKNTVNLLSTISGERIRDEFIKGVTSAKSQKHFFEMLDKYNLFDWVFKGLNVDKQFIARLGSYNYDDIIVVLASLLKNNNLDVLRKKLNDLKYSVEEVKGISFLIAMLKLDVDTAVTLKKAEQHAGVSQDQIRNFCGKQGVNGQLLDAFEDFRLSVSGPEMMEKTGLPQGKELGQAIHQAETENFKKLLGMS